jgi:hypothetical protein
MISAAQLPWGLIEAERAFDRASRSRRRASVMRRLRRRCAECARLAVHDVASLRRSGTRGTREIPLDAITGTVEPGRAEQFDREFRPAPLTRCRWLRIWLAEHTGQVLPPISVSQVGDAYAIRDGHHRVSVAKARGALTIIAVVA